MYEDSGPAMNATAAADAAGGAGDESRFPESVLITWVPDDWTLTPGAVFAVESAKFPFLNDGGERQPFGGLQIRIVACSADVRNWSVCDTKSSGYWKNDP